MEKNKSYSIAEIAINPNETEKYCTIDIRKEKNYMECRERATTDRNKLFLSIAENISILLKEYFRDATHNDVLRIIDNNYNDMAFIINSRKSIAEREKEIRENKKQLAEMENNLDLSLNY